MSIPIYLHWLNACRWCFYKLRKHKRKFLSIPPSRSCFQTHHSSYTDPRQLLDSDLADYNHELKRGCCRTAALMHAHLLQFVFIIQSSNLLVWANLYWMRFSQPIATKVEYTANGIYLNSARPWGTFWMSPVSLNHHIASVVTCVSVYLQHYGDRITYGRKNSARTQLTVFLSPPFRVRLRLYPPTPSCTVYTSSSC